ncbi:MAG: HAMP domain-containing sensor histidine kinase, partial [Bacteroidota bacterium]
MNQNFKAQKADLEKEISGLFKDAVLERQDSLIGRLILSPLMEVLPDSVQDVDLHPGVRRWMKPRTHSRYSFFARTDSFSLPRNRETDEQVQFKIVKTPPPNDMNYIQRRMVRSLAFTLGGLDSEDFDFISFGEDSLRLMEIDTLFQHKLVDAEMNLAYRVLRGHRDSLPEVKKGFYTYGIRGDIPFNTTYRAHVKDTNNLLFAKMFPLVLFTLFLTLITGISFALVYRSLKQQQRLTEMKNNFISNVTHELQTPITSVGVALEALSNFDVLENKDKTEEYLAISKNELNRLSILVDKVLKMALFEEDLRLHLEPVDLKPLLVKILSSMRLQFEQKGALVEHNFEGNAFPVLADRVHLTSVIYNLLDNALKYSKADAKVKVGLSNTPNGVQLTVQDQGIGIPDVYQEKIFDKFFRVPTGNLHQVKGHGLGLSYVATIIEKLNAKIKVESVPDQGSTFSLYFNPISESNL